jgi:glycosyltransferase involved in cell wall biosynthesis
MRIGLTIVEKGATRPSGVHRYAANLIAGISRAHPEHELMVFTHRNAALLGFLPVDIQRRVRFSWYRPIIDDSISNILWHLLVLPFHARRHKLDVVHVTNGRPVIKAGSMAVLTLHDVAERDIPGKFDLVRGIYRTYLLYPYMRRQARVLTVSTRAKDDIVRHLGIRPDDIAVLPNTTQWSPTPPSRPAENPAFVYVGRIDHPSKNLPLLIEAFDRAARTLPSIELHLIGADSWRAEVVHTAARSAVASARITFHGWLSDMELRQWYRRAHIVCLPSLHEGFGLPIIEALRAGAPVLAADSGALPGVLGTREGLLPPHEVSAWAATMESLATDEDRRLALLEIQQAAQENLAVSPEEIGSRAITEYALLLRE